MTAESHLKRIGIEAVTMGLVCLVLVTSSEAQARRRKLDDQVSQHYEQGKYAEAIPIAWHTVEIAEGRYADAEPLHKRATAIWEKAAWP